MSYVEASAVSFNEEDSRQISLTCKSLSAADYRDKGGNSLLLRWDLLSDEKLIDQIQLLLLGRVNGKKTVWNIGIMAVCAGHQDRSLRRVGYFEVCLRELDRRLWEIAKSQVTIL